jgi:hypothetical protein
MKAVDYVDNLIKKKSYFGKKKKNRKWFLTVQDEPWDQHPEKPGKQILALKCSVLYQKLY